MTPYDSERTQHHLSTPNGDARSSADVSGTTTAVAAVITHEDSRLEPPPLHFKFKWRNPTLYLIFLVLCNVLIPCLLYYLLLIYTKLDFIEVIGISSSALGLSSCFDAPFRVWKLTRYRTEYGPLNDDVWWHLDFFMWFTTTAVMVFAIPLIVGPVAPAFNFFLMSMPMLVLPAGLMFLLTLIPLPPLPFWLSSDPPRTPKEQRKPAVYYILEDVVAVDFGYKRPWRHAIAKRYDESPMFRSHMRLQTWYWVLMSLVHAGVTAAVAWGSSYHFAFGFVLGLFFIWAIVAGFGSWFIARTQLRKEHEAWARTHGYKNEKPPAVSAV